MKILVILNDLDIGGAQNYTIKLMNEFIKLGHTVALRVLSENIMLKDRLLPDIELKTWRRNYKIDFGVLRKIRSEIKLTKYDGIISSYSLYIKIATLGLFHRTISLYPIHSTVDRNFKSYLSNFIIFRLKSKHERYVTSIDNQTRYLTKKHVLKPGFFSQIYNGIDTDVFSYIPSEFNREESLRKLGIPEDHRVILMVAGYREEKRHIDAVKSLKVLREEFSNVTLVCVGDNRTENRDKLQFLVDRSNIDNVKLLTATEAGDVKMFYWIADIFTLTSNKVETFPISVLEAMACGLPCVITDTGGARDIIKDLRLGEVVEVENIGAIANAWKRMLFTAKIKNKEFIKAHVQTNFQIRKSAEQYINLIKNTHVN